MSAIRKEDDAPRGFVPMREYLKLRERCEELEEIVKQHGDERVAGVREDTIALLRTRLKVSPQQAQIIAHMAATTRPAVTLQHLMECVLESGARRSLPGVLVCKINGRVRALGGPPYTIRGVRGPTSTGWYVTDDGRAWLKERVPEIFNSLHDNPRMKRILGGSA